VEDVHEQPVRDAVKDDDGGGGDYGYDYDYVNEECLSRRYDVAICRTGVVESAGGTWTGKTGLHLDSGSATAVT
jgi:hypothetical protein